MTQFRLVLVLLFCGLICAQATAPKLTSILPTGAQLGTEVEVRFEGERLEDTEEIICYEPGITFLKFNLITNKLVKAQLRIEPACELGEHHLRLRTATGLSELMTFFAGPFPVLTEQEPNNDASHAQVIPPNTTMEGLLTNEDVDCLAFEAKTGERISAEVEAMRLGRANLDTRMTIEDEKGNTIAASDDTWLALQDPFVSFIAPADGRYTITLREVTYGGSDKSRYRLHLGTFARPTCVFPLGGMAGETIPFIFYSPVTGYFTNELKLPGLPSEKFGLFPEFDGMRAPSPNWLRLSTFPNVIATVPNEDREHATVSSNLPPLALNGIISQKGQANWFQVPVEKGVPLNFNVYARRLRSPLDSVLEVSDSNGKKLESNDDSAGADSSLKLTPSETNVWVKIYDRLAAGGPEFGYRIEITAAQPSIAVKIPEVARNDTQSRQFIAVPRGNRFAALISAKRSNVSGPLDFRIEGLPEGITMHAATMAANIDSMPLVFEAAPDAPLAGKLLDLTASGTNSSGTVTGKFRQEIELVQGPPNNVSYYSTIVDKFCVAVLKEAPFKLRIVEPPVPIVQGGSMKLEIVAERADSFAEPIELKMLWNPPGTSSDSETTIPKGSTNVFYQLNASAGAELSTNWQIAVLGSATVDDGKVFVSSQLATLPVATPFVSGKIETTYLNPGKTVRLTLALQQSKPFEGKATIRLMGLPDKVTAEPKEFTKDDQEVIFEVKAEADCAVGSHKNLFCAADILQDGHTIPHTLASGGILRIVPPKKDQLKVAEAGGKK